MVPVIVHVEIPGEAKRLLCEHGVAFIDYSVDDLCRSGARPIQRLNGSSGHRLGSMQTLTLQARGDE